MNGRWQPIETLPNDAELVVLWARRGLLDYWAIGFKADNTFYEWPHEFPPQAWHQLMTGPMP